MSTLNRLFVCMFLVVFTSAIEAQVTTASIVGRATDSSGAAVPGTTIRVENLRTGVVQTATTDEGGNFTVTELPPGEYKVRANKTAFAGWEVPDVQLAVGDRLNLDVRLRVGAVSESVDVVAASPALHTQTAELGTLINDRAVQDLPLNGRDFVQLSQLAAGANAGVQNSTLTGNRPDDRRNTSATGLNGLVANNFLVDGIDDNERAISTIMIKPSEDAISQLIVLSNNYSAEYSHSAGAVINIITKSGTNRLHGAAFELLDNDKLDATNFFVNAGGGTKPERRQNDWGGNMSGPIRKDKTFFFGDFEQLDIRNGAAYVSTVPTLAEHNGIFTGVNAIFDPLSINPANSVRTRFPNDVIPASRINAVAQRFVNLYPTPTSPGFANNFVSTPVFTQRDSKFDLRTDQQISDRTSLFGRYSFQDTGTFLPPQLPDVNVSGIGTVSAGGDSGNYAGTTTQRYQQAQIHATHMFTPALVGGVDLAYMRGNLLTVPVNYGKDVSRQFGLPGINFDLLSTGFPQIGVSGYRGVGGSGYEPEHNIDNDFLLKSDFNSIHGRHTLKFGGGIIHRQVIYDQSDSRTGSFSFNTNFTNDPTGAVSGSGNSVASMLIGYPASTSRVALLVDPLHFTDEYSAYVQDDWRATDWLTFNLGLRYDIFTPWRDLHNALSQPDLSTGKWLIAGQNGVSRTAGVHTDFGDIAPRFGFAATLRRHLVLRGGYGLSYEPANHGSNNEMRNPPFTSTLSISPSNLTPINLFSDGLPAATPTDPNNPTGILYVTNHYYQDQRVQQLNLTLETEIHSGWVLTSSFVGALGRHLPATYNLDQAPPGAGSVNPRRPYYAMFPNVTTITIRDDMGNMDSFSLQETVQHRYKNGLSLIGTYTWGHAIANVQTNGCGCPANGPVQSTTNFKLERGNSDIDIRHRATALLNYELPIARGAKGALGFVAKGWQVNSIVALQSGMPLTISNSTSRDNTGGSDRPNRICDGQTPPGGQTVSHFFDTSCFVAQPTYQFGNSGRNVLHGPDLQNVDFSMFKDFPLAHWEQAHIRFRAESFNIFNRANFGTPTATLGSAAFGSISDTANNTPRRMQFGLQLLW